MRRPDPEAALDALYARILNTAERPGEARALIESTPLEDATLLALLRRALPARFLEALAATPPWSEHRRVLGAVAQNPKAPRALALRLLPALFWRDLADVAASPRAEGSVRARAEGLLREQAPEMRLGERVALARLATPPVLRLLLNDAEAMVTRAALSNPRLKEEDLLLALRGEAVPRALIEETAASARWRESYAVRLALVLQRRTPLGVALAQLTSLQSRDLDRVAATEELAPLVQAAAARAAGRRGAS